MLLSLLFNFKDNSQEMDIKSVQGPQQDRPLEYARKQSKWSPEEDAKIIEFRQDGMKWEDISKHLPGRSAISCRLHYQNYLEKDRSWDESRKAKLANLYQRYVESMALVASSIEPCMT